MTQRHRDGERRHEDGEREAGKLRPNLRQRLRQKKAGRRGGTRNDLETEDKTQTQTQNRRDGTGPEKATLGETRGCPVAAAPSAPAPPPSCLGCDLRARADAINGQAAAGRRRAVSQRPRHRRRVPARLAPPAPAARGRRPRALPGKGPRMRSSDLWPAAGRSASSGSRHGVFDPGSATSCWVPRAVGFSSLCLLLPTHFIRLL